jgi:AcrR family transcriptional regulator
MPRPRLTGRRRGVRGLDAVSMRAVAQRLGLTPMALYGYFRNKEELLDGVLGQLLAEVPLPSAETGWRAMLEQLSYGVREVAARHPTAMPLVLTRPAVCPAALRLVEATYQALLAAGVPTADIPRLERLLGSLMLGHAISEVSGRFGTGTLDPGERRAQFAPGELPGHEKIAEMLDRRADLDADFRADLDDVLDLVALLAARAQPA